MTVLRHLPAQEGPTGTSPLRGCGNCRFFRADPREIEASIPGLVTMGSGYAAVRGDDGLCDRHDRYLAATSSCADHELRR